MADLTIEDLEWLGGRARLSGRHGDADIGVPADKLLALVKIARRSLAPTPAAVPGLVFGDERIDGSHVAFASDWQEYNLCRARSDPRAWFWSTPGVEVRTASTADEAIAAATAHNAARLKGGE